MEVLPAVVAGSWVCSIWSRGSWKYTSRSSGSWASTCHRGHLVLGTVLTLMIQLGSVPTIVMTWFLNMSTVGTDDPTNESWRRTYSRWTAWFLEGVPSLWPHGSWICV